MKSYYPWKVQVLMDWLKQELNHHQDIRNLAEALQVPFNTLKSWLTDPMPEISLEHIRAIARYRGWGLQQTINWLDINPFHMEELINRDMRS